MPVNSIEILKDLMTGFSIHPPDRGDFILLLRTLARGSAAGFPLATRRIHLFLTMQQLIAPGTLVKAHLQRMSLDFPNAMMHFNHLVKLHQQKIIHRDFLLLLMGRGAGVLCANNTTKVDFIIPFLLQDDIIHSSNVAAIVGQAKTDRSFAVNAQPGMFAVMHPRRIGFPREGDPAVPLIRVFMALSSLQFGVTIERHEPTADYSAIIYDIWIAGLTPDVYAHNAPVTHTDQSIWLAALAATRVWETIYRVHRRASEMRAVRRSFHAAAADNVDHWCR